MKFRRRAAQGRKVGGLKVKVAQMEIRCKAQPAAWKLVTFESWPDVEIVA